jgi:hypothetical protein
MKLTISMVSRGHPQLLAKTVQQTLAHMTRPDTTLFVGLDHDDHAGIAEVVTWNTHPQLVLSIKEREDTIAGKWNRVLTDAPADAYYVMVNYAPAATKGFDEVIVEALSLFPDGIGCVCNDLANLSFPKGQAVTAKMAELMGGIYPEYFPYWFVDHWFDDIAKMTGRMVYADFRVDVSARPGTQEMREPGYWATVYDALRPLRHQQANAIIAALQEPFWRKQMLRRNFTLIDQRSTMINNTVRAAIPGNVFTVDERYQRIKAKAVQAMADCGRTIEVIEQRACA